MPRDPYAAYLRAVREQREFAERAHRRQMLGNVFTSFFQAMPGNRPLQVTTALVANHVGSALKAAIRKEEKWWERAADDLGDLLLTGGLVAYLTNSDGGVSIQYDVPDVESPGGGSALNGGDPFLVPARAARRPAARPPSRTGRAR